MDFSGNERTRQARKSISAAISLVLSLTLVIAALCPVAGAASGLTADPIPKPPYRLHLSSTVNNSDLTPPTSQPGEHGVAWVDPEEANVGETVRIGGFGFGTDASQVVVWFSFGKRRPRERSFPSKTARSRWSCPMLRWGFTAVAPVGRSKCSSAAVPWPRIRGHR